MIHAYADTSVDTPIVSVGYVLYRSSNGEEELLDTGTRVINADADDRRIDWDSMCGEYYAAIVATRASLAYTNEPFILNLDCTDVVRKIKERTWGKEAYFPHALYSFLGRFDEYHVRRVHRENNEVAHEQARVGLKIGREIQQGVL